MFPWTVEMFLMCGTKNNVGYVLTRKTPSSKHLFLWFNKAQHSMTSVQIIHLQHDTVKNKNLIKLYINNVLCSAILNNTSTE